MSDENRHEAADLSDFEVEDGGDTLDGPPGDDPLDRGVVVPQHWSSAMRYGTTGAEQEQGESLDQLLAEEEPEAGETDLADDASPDVADDPDAAEEDVDGLLLDDGPDPRAGRLVATDDESDPDVEADLVARDAGIDGGAATAEEAAMHVVDSDDNDIRSE
jgi:hypothetical protein